MTAPFIVWKSEYSVGQAELDAHHLRIMKIVNDLYSATVTQAWSSEATDLRDRLLNHAQSHFQAEEEVMRKIGFPDVDAHANEHQAFIERLQELLQQMQTESEENPIPKQLLRFLKEWWLTHILKMDKAYAPYIAKSATADH